MNSLERIFSFGQINEGRRESAGIGGLLACGALAQHHHVKLNLLSQQQGNLPPHPIGIRKDEMMDSHPEKIYGWLNGHLSIARFYGGIKFNGADYVIDYNDPEKPLVLVKKQKKAKSSRQGKTPDVTQRK